MASPQQLLPPHQQKQQHGGGCPVLAGLLNETESVVDEVHKIREDFSRLEVRLANLTASLKQAFGNSAVTTVREKQQGMYLILSPITKSYQHYI